MMKMMKMMMQACKHASPCSACCAGWKRPPSSPSWRTLIDRRIRELQLPTNHKKLLKIRQQMTQNRPKIEPKSFKFRLLGAFGGILWHLGGILEACSTFEHNLGSNLGGLGSKLRGLSAQVGPKLGPSWTKLGQVGAMLGSD